jgi:hypothetical protein
VSPPPRLPLVVRPSRWKPWASTGLFCVATTAMVWFFHPGALALLMPFLALTCLATLLGGFDRRPRLILERDGLKWRESLRAPLVFTPWEQVSAAGHELDLRARFSHDNGWLLLAFAPRDAALPAAARIRIRGQNVWGEDLPDLIRALAPHVRVIDLED